MPEPGSRGRDNSAAAAAVMINSAHPRAWTGPARELGFVRLGPNGEHVGPKRPFQTVGPADPDTGGTRFVPLSQTPDGRKPSLPETHQAATGDRGEPAPSSPAAETGEIIFAPFATDTSDISASTGTGNGKQDTDRTTRHPAGQDAGPGVTPVGPPSPPDRGGPTPTDGEGESYEAVFARFREQINETRRAIDAADDPADVPNYNGISSTGAIVCWLDDPDDPRPLRERERTLTYFPPKDDDGTVRDKERGRYRALTIAAAIPDPEVREDLEQMIGHSSETGQVITRIPRAPHIDILTPEERSAVDMPHLRRALRTIDTMVQWGIAPTSVNISRMVEPRSGRILFRDFMPIGEGDLVYNTSPLSTARVFGSVTQQFRENPRHNRQVPVVADNILLMARGAVRDHFLYEGPRIAKSTEDIPDAHIRAVYEFTRPAGEGLTSEAFDASRLHDLSLNRDLGEDSMVEGRLAILRVVRASYQDIVYTDAESGGRTLRTDDHGNNLLWSNESALRARLGLAYIPVSEIRIQDREFTSEDKATLNHNLAGVIDDMLPTDRQPVPRALTPLFSGNINKVVGLTLLSRTQVHTSIAFPASEVHRINDGPDATVPFRHETGNYEYGIDWKLEEHGRARGAGNVTVGRICLDIFNNMPNLRESPTVRRLLGSREATPRDALLITATLLRDEGLDRQKGGRELEVIETEYLNRIQTREWQRIEATAYGGNGIEELGQKARFRA